MGERKNSLSSSPFLSKEGSESTSLLQDYPDADISDFPPDDPENTYKTDQRTRPHRFGLTSDGLWPNAICRTLLTVVGGFVVVLTSAYFVSLFISPTPPESGSPELLSKPTCETSECVAAASEIIRNLDPDYKNIDACTDFDQYVCGGWRDSHDMRPDQGSIFAGTFMQEASQTRLRHLLESSESSDPSDSNNFGKLKAAYGACIDEDTIKKRGSKPLEKILEDFEKIYSLDTTSSPQSAAHLTDAVLDLIKLGVRALISAYVSPDDRDPDSVVIFVNPPSHIGLPAREYYNNTETMADYTAVVKRVLGSFINSKMKHPIEEVVTFEKKLADISPDKQTQEDVTKYYNPLSVEDTESLLSQISFSSIISDLAPSDYKADRLIVGSPSYMVSLSRLLEVTPREIVQLFFKWKIIQTYSSHIEDEKIKPLLEFNNVLAGKDPNATKDRWRKCIGILDEDLGWILSRFYVLDAFPEESKKLGDQIVSDIKERFVFTLDQTAWMSPEVRRLGTQKVGNIVQKIGYPTKSPDVMDPADVEKYYRNLKISDETFFENGVAVAKFDTDREWTKLGKPTDRNEWDMTAPTVNAYYNPPGNEIVFPAGIMQPPVFYGPAAPLYLAYGAFGAVSGHELSHAFDSTGRHYDETGNYTNWWDEKTVESFEERAQCFVDQYSEFTVPVKEPEPLHVNGRLTLGENIADAGGIGAAFHAWKKRDESSPDPYLPGLVDFTKEQLFFMSYANWWCSKTTPEAAKQAIYNDPHAPKPARIIGTMANSEEFKEAFNCPKKEPTCKLW